jgi:hypothetical protein
VLKPTEEAAREHSACGLPYYSTILLIHDNESMLETYSKKLLTKAEFNFKFLQNAIHSVAFVSKCKWTKLLLLQI